MKSLSLLIAFISIATFGFSQEIYKGDTTFTLKANSKLKINVPKEETWWLAKKIDCVAFDNTHQDISLTSTCSEAQKVKFIRTVQKK